MHISRLATLAALTASIGSVATRPVRAQATAPAACRDSLYQVLRKKPVDSMSTREYAVFLEHDRACIQATATQPMASSAAPSSIVHDVTPPTPVAPVVAQAVISDRPRSQKDGTTATLFALLITGGGHFYAGESGTGALLLIGSIGSVLAGYSSSHCDAYGYCDMHPLAVGEAVAFGFWLYGVIDAHNAVGRVNLYADSRSNRQLLGFRVALGR